MESGTDTATAQKGAKNNLKNCRPILNLCVATTFFEKCILKCIRTLAEVHG